MSRIASTAVMLGRFTSPALLFPNLKAASPSEALRELCSALQREGVVQDSLSLYHAALNREMLGGGTVVDGWALPHGRMNHGARLGFALGRPTSPITWFDGSTVQLILFFAVPDAQSGEYLSLLSCVARMAADPEISRQLLSASTAAELWELLQGNAVKAPLNAGAPQARSNCST